MYLLFVYEGSHDSVQGNKYFIIIISKLRKLQDYPKYYINNFIKFKTFNIVNLLNVPK